MKKIIILLLVIFLILAGAVFAGIYYYIYSPLKMTNPDSFVIERGDSVSKISNQLESGKYIRSAFFFKLYIRYRGGETRIRTGEYPFEGEISPVEIYQWFLIGNETLAKVTIKEGLTLNQIAFLLEDKGICSAEDFIKVASDQDFVNELGIPGKTAEGYLFPDTYNLRENSTPEEVVSFLAQSFFSRLKSIYPSYAEMSQEKLKEKIILASIIEKEYRRSEEAARIASVFYNRLDTGMKLQSCATIVYAITEEYKKEHPSRLFYSDLEIESEYNTYLHKGLPAGPISNPGGTALNAAFFPEKTPYLFFVVDDPAIGSHTFTTTLSEHNRAADSYISNFTIK